MARSNPDHVIRRNNASAGNLSPIDIFIGSRIRLRRIVSGLSEKELADLLDVNSQQIQKYESGASRVGATRLFEISRILKMPISYFFDDMPKETPETSATGLTDPIPDTANRRVYPNILTEENFDDRETMELVYAFHSISKDIRGLTLDLIKSLAIPGVTH